MDILELMKKRRSIRKYQAEQVPRDIVDKIVEAGLYAPNAGGGQRSMIVTLHNAQLAAKLGRLNLRLTAVNCWEDMYRMNSHR